MTQSIAFINLGPNLVQYFSAVGERLGPDYAPVFFALHPKSRSILRQLGREVYPKRLAVRGRGAPDPPELDGDALITRLRTRSDRERVRSRAPEFLRLADALRAFFERTRPAGVFLWNGSGLAAAIAEQLARARGLAVVFGENGYLPGTLQLDPLGVNAFSSIRDRWSLERVRAIRWRDDQREELRRLLTAYRNDRLPPPEGPRRRIRASWLAYLQQSLHDLRHRDLDQPGNRLVPREAARLPERFAFFPLQVRDDSQLTIHSPIYGNRLDEAVTDLGQALRETVPGLSLVVKLHPADLRKTDYDPLVQAYPDVIWIGGGDVRAILKRSDLVVTINSTVGIEALIFGKPVVTLGNSLYGLEGLVHAVDCRQDLPGALANAISARPDARLVEDYLLFQYYIAFTRGHWKDFSAPSVGRVAQRIIAIVGDSPSPPFAWEGPSP
jgi:capsular polysaccharide export protein